MPVTIKKIAPVQTAATTVSARRPQTFKNVGEEFGLLALGGIVAEDSPREVPIQSFYEIRWGEIRHLGINAARGLFL